ncbi:MAG: winged helix-turn-helix transcriptional regulator [Anaerolineaceae bacterium]|nr:winged helix-turn-helix transcriptional regulator [Anaerolineaceae bacterium]MBN2676692.1 winged helix-turn-helix transcriptional regulator [Anaerolineaceae bacterium]
MTAKPSGDQYVLMLNALANPIRLRILAALSADKLYVSELARELRMSRPLLHMHLQKLESAGLIIGHHEVSSDGKALRYYQVAPFHEELSPQRISEIVKSLTINEMGKER